MKLNFDHYVRGPEVGTKLKGDDNYTINDVSENQILKEPLKEHENTLTIKYCYLL